MPGTAEAAAKEKIQSKYNQLGGVKSPLGLEINPNVQFNENYYFIAYRGGEIRFYGDPLDPNNTSEAEEKIHTKVDVWFRGIECFQQQEGGRGDNIYGGVGVVAPEMASSQSYTFPTNMPYVILNETNDKIHPEAQLLYQGPPSDIVLCVQLVENDSDNVSNFKTLFTNAFNAIGATLIPGVSITNWTAVLAGITTSLINISANLLGTGDDFYNPNYNQLNWNDLERQTQSRTYLGQPLNYTHAVPVEGTDDGGSRGKYTFYFDVRVTKFQI